jgi:hypothetical protein
LHFRQSRFKPQHPILVRKVLLIEIARRKREILQLQLRIKDHRKALKQGSLAEQEASKQLIGTLSK